jgi:hypothetical protein
MGAQQQDGQSGWIGIPSVPPERAAQAFIAFYLAIGAAIAIDVLLITHNHRPEAWQITAEKVFDDGGQIVAWALAATWPIMEAMRMVIARIMEKRTYLRGQEKGREEGIEIGAERSNERWREWIQRRDQAEARGEPFNAPAPDEDNDGTA